MNITDLKFPVETIEDLFPCGDEGENVRPSEAAIAKAGEVLGVSRGELLWHTPDVFSVRYGSSYVASASAGDKKVRFHSTEGDFKEGDDYAYF